MNDSLLARGESLVGFRAFPGVRESRMVNGAQGLPTAAQTDLAIGTLAQPANKKSAKQPRHQSHVPRNA